MSRALALTFGPVILALCAACAPSETAVEPLADAPFSELITTAIEDAKHGDASEDQVATLVRAKVAGQVTFEEARIAVLAQMDCVEQGGGKVEYLEQTEESGLVIPSFIVIAEDETTLDNNQALYDGCSTREAFWVNKVFQLQPTSQAARDAYLAEIAPEIRACLESHGYATDPDATPQELSSQARVVAAETSDAIVCDD